MIELPACMTVPVDLQVPRYWVTVARDEGLKKSTEDLSRIQSQPSKNITATAHRRGMGWEETTEDLSRIQSRSRSAIQNITAHFAEEESVLLAEFSGNQPQSENKHIKCLR